MHLSTYLVNRVSGAYCGFMMLVLLSKIEGIWPQKGSTFIQCTLYINNFLNIKCRLFANMYQIKKVCPRITLYTCRHSQLCSNAAAARHHGRQSLQSEFPIICPKIIRPISSRIGELLLISKQKYHLFIANGKNGFLNKSLIYLKKILTDLEGKTAS